MKAIFTGLCILFSAVIWGQKTYTLAECQNLAKENAPRQADLSLIKQMGEIKVEQAGKSWYPALNLSGKISYQSDVVTVAVTDPNVPVNFPEIPHDQYGLNLDLTQNLYDGGKSQAKKNYERAVMAAEIQQVEVDLFGLKGRVNSYFFSVLLIQEKLRNMQILLETLSAREESMKTALSNGVLQEADMKVIQLEKLKVKQSMIELRSGRTAFLDALGILCGQDFPGNVELSLPNFEASESTQLNRPEHLLFDLKYSSMEAGKELVGRKRLPVLYAFGQTGYGKPGYNMLQADWDTYYMLGAGLKWNLWDWSFTKNEKQVIGYQQQLLQNKRATFDKELESMLVQQEAVMEQVRLSLQMEKEVVALQEEITESAAVRLANGTSTATEYVTELNKESQARVRLASRKVHLMQAIANYLTLQGNL